MKVTRDRIVDADPAEVWETLTDEALLSIWLDAEVSFDPVAGGEGRFEFSDGEIREATDIDVEPLKRIAWTWWGEDRSAGNVEVRVEAVSPRRTRVVVVESQPGTVASTNCRWGPALSGLAMMHAAVCS